MNKSLALIVAASSLLSVPAFANPALAKDKICMGCHKIDSSGMKGIGPTFKDIAAKYAGQSDAADKLTIKIMKGGAGVWSAVPMPPNPQVSAAEAKQLAQWILTTK